MTTLAEAELIRLQEEALKMLDPYQLDQEGKKLLQVSLIKAWRNGFKIGRQEGKLDQRMLGGEA